MPGCCHGSSCDQQNVPKDGAPTLLAWRRVLWIALALNGGMFAGELIAGIAAESVSLRADALDFLGDAANYAISLSVAGLALGWRARAALLKGYSLVALGFWVAGSTVWQTVVGTIPEAKTMGAVGVLALLVNLAVAAMLYRCRRGDANMRSVWICSRNDALGNVAVMLAALGVFGTGMAWPDLCVAVAMGLLALSGAWTVTRHARAELRSAQTTPPVQPSQSISVSLGMPASRRR